MDSADAIVIRSAEPTDAPAISALLGMPGTMEGTLQLPDVPLASRLEMLERVDPQSCRLVALAGKHVVGWAALHAMQAGLRRAHVRLLAIALAPDWQGRGVGRKLMVRLLDWADNWGGVLRIELNVHVDNERGIALYKSLGFVEEGRHRAYVFKEGSYADALTMARLHPRPPQLPQ